MKIYTKTINRNNSLKDFEDKINLFLKENIQAYNSVFLSPVWAKKIYHTYRFEYQWTVFFLNKDIIAIHLTFEEYRGREKLSKIPIFLRKLLIPFIKFFFTFESWKSPLFVKKNLSRENILYIKNIFVEKLKLKKSVKFSPLLKEHSALLPSIQWATYRFNFENLSYFDVFSNYSRSLKRSLKKTSFNKLYVCRILDLDNLKEVKRYIDWVNIVQKTTNKAFIYNAESLMNEKKQFNKNDFVYEIFIMENKEKLFFGSLTLYGDKYFVTEAEANVSLEAKNLKILVHDFLRDHIVKYCFDHNIKFYDLAGFNPNKKITNKESGIKFAKQKFNAEKLKYDLFNR